MHYRLEVINEIAEMHPDCHLEYPEIISGEGVDLSKYQKQESDCPTFEYEYVQQNGGGITGDSFNGVILFPLDNGTYLKVNYSC
jgi:hypothetical protein